MMKQVLAILMAMLLFITPVLAEDLAVDWATQVIDVLANGSPEQQTALYDAMNDDMQKALQPGDLALLWPQLCAQFGQYMGSAGDVQTVETNGMTVHICPLEFEFAMVTVAVTADEDGRLAGLQVTKADAKKVEEVPDDTDAWVEQEVTFGTEPWVLSGTVTMPKNAAESVAAVVLVQGSGASDRDEAVYALAPFRDIAHGLAKRGIASIRYDKRTFTYGTEIAASPDYAAFTVEEEYIRDVHAAARLLSNLPGIDNGRIYVFGHSLGAMLAPRICEESDGLFYGMILANGSNKTLLEIMIRQVEDSTGRQLTDEEKVSLIQPARYFEEMEEHDSPAVILQRLMRPTLIINGSRDFQVNLQEGREAWEAALPDAAPWLTMLWPDVNHMLMAPDASAEEAGTPAEYMIPCHVDEDVLDAVALFIGK
ncbi:MAG: alpha/beta fold hydrolase [Clostridia bacterium]|nr:alpha/beta fold hydrolase [Clostridia bacterium]